ncbi:MAG: hypothetical protein AMJ90_01400 [candidate division Zixibacteria bacterium SM23_73_2]|nr:MAG: hypothetical protein AMJ90_01400 [candidate division Zixibacteria bacterium SM23_73_2]
MTNLLTRVLVAVIFVPLLLGLSFLGEFYFFIFIQVLIALGLLEFSNMAKKMGAEIPDVLFLGTGLIIGVVCFFWGDKYVLGLLFLSFLMVCIYQFFKEGVEKVGKNVAFFICGTVYVPIFFSFLLLIRQLPLSLGIDYKIGGFWVIFILICVWLCDTLAYFVGLSFGKHKLLPRVSPKKSLEGAFGGMLGAVLGGVLSFYLILNFVPFFHLLIMSLIIAVFGQIGDLVESSFKRGAKIKESSFILPGHGGILDRFDSLLFVSPLVYYYLKLIVYN